MKTDPPRPRRATAPAGVPAGSRPEASAPQEASSDRAPSTEERIRVAAYFLAEQRGFGPGRELDDWLAAEAMLRAQASVRQGRSQPKQQPGETRRQSSVE